MTKTVAELRSIQRAAAEIDVARVNIVLGALEDRRRGQLANVHDQQKCWSASLSRGSFDPQLAGYWSSTIRDSEVELAEIDFEVRETEEARDQARDAWVAAIARSDAAEVLLRQVRREVDRRLEEAALGEAADRSAQRHANP